jgi:hypothetical protein
VPTIDVVFEEGPTDGFFKEARNDLHSPALYFFHHNFCCIRKSLRVAPLWLAPFLTSMDMCGLVLLVDMMECRPSRASGCWNCAVASALTRTCRVCPAHRLLAEARYREGRKTLPASFVRPWMPWNMQRTFLGWEPGPFRADSPRRAFNGRNLKLRHHPRGGKNIIGTICSISNITQYVRRYLANKNKACTVTTSHRRRDSLGDQRAL